MGALVPDAEILVVDPLEAVGRDFPSGFLHRRHSLRVAGQRCGDAKHGHRHGAFGEQAMHAPEAGARAVFVNRFHVHVALARPRCGADDFGKERFGRCVAMQNVVLTAFLVVDDELNGDAGVIWPARMRRVAPIADKIARIVVHHDPR